MIEITDEILDDLPALKLMIEKTLVRNVRREFGSILRKEYAKNGLSRQYKWNYVEYLGRLTTQYEKASKLQYQLLMEGNGNLNEVRGLLNQPGIITK